MKAILVIDTPDKCAECPVYDHTFTMCSETLSKKRSFNIDKLSDCPLKPMPQRMKADYDTITTCEVTEKVVAIGWNACIESILGEEE